MKSAPSRRDRLRHILADLRMPGALEALDAILQGVDGGALTAPEAIEQLLSAQIQLRNNRRLQAAMRSSRLPAVKQLRDFDFTFQPSLRREQIESLHELGFVERRENVIFLGPPGVGKTHLAISLAIAAAQSGRRVYYGTLADLITSLEEAQAASRLQARLKVLTHPSLLVVDEIGYLPISRTGAMLFFQLMTRRYEHASTVLTSNKSFEEWGDVFGDDVMAAALIDRLVHHCHLVTIRGNSYRLRQHTELWQALHAPQEADAPTRRRRAARQEVPTAKGSSPRRSVRFSPGGTVRFWSGVDNANDRGFAIVLALRKPGPIRWVPQPPNQLRVARQVGGSRDDEKAVRADDGQSDVWPGRQLRHLARALVRQEVDVMIVLNEQRQHRTSDKHALLIDVHQHGDASPFDQRAHSLSFGPGVRHGNSFPGARDGVRTMASPVYASRSDGKATRPDRQRTSGHHAPIVGLEARTEQALKNA
jgi:DNA replication protein DnaC